MSSEIVVMKNEWTDRDFDELSWHDNHVHGLQIHESQNGTGVLILQLDHILEWLPPVDGQYSFRIAPATLTFQYVSGLRLELDYLSVSAGMTPFSIGAIARERVEYPTGYVSYHWKISINWPEGYIEFEAPTFTQKLEGAIVVTQEQLLTREQRVIR